MPTGPQFHDRYRTVDESRIIDAIILLGWAFHEPSDTLRTTARGALEDWIKGGLGVRTAPTGTRLFDPVEVVYHLKDAGRKGQDGFWASHYVTTSRRLVEDLRAHPPGRLDVTLRRRFCLRHVTPGRTLRLRMPLPLASRCREPDIRPLPTAPGDACTVVDGRLELHLRATDRAEAWLGAQVGFTPQAAIVDDGPFDPALYLKPAEGLIRVTETVAALSHHLAGNQPPEGAIRAFWDFILDTFLAGPVHYDQIPADTPLDWVLASGCCDCHLASAFLVALCRARGIPARLVSGNFLYPRSPTMHYWAEIHTDADGWRSFDFMSWDLSRGGQDEDWRECFFGRVDARLVTQCLPRAMTGPVGIPIPPDWRVLQTTEGRAVKIDLIDLGGHSLHTDYVTVENKNKNEKETSMYMEKA